MRQAIRDLNTKGDEEVVNPDKIGGRVCLAQSTTTVAKIEVHEFLAPTIKWNPEALERLGLTDVKDDINEKMQTENSTGGGSYRAAVQAADAFISWV